MARIIVALDGMDVEGALFLTNKLKNSGVEFISKANDLLDDGGTAIISELKKYGGVMADPKLHDIPNTVKNRIKKYAIHKPDFITIHASGGIEMMESAMENCGESKVLAVTVLTSLSSMECFGIFREAREERVLKFAKDAVEAGVHGIVCSPQELQLLVKYPELKNLIKVTPGIRPQWHIDPKDDQAMITTPRDAVLMGADYLVIGRPIVNAKNPIVAIRDTQEEIIAALSEKSK